MERCVLKDLADIQTGPFGSQLHKEDYVSSGTPIVTVEHLGKRLFSKQNLPLVSDKDKIRLNKYVLKTGDTVFSRVGSVDRCSYVDNDHDGWLFSGRCLRVRPSESLDPLYLYYFFCLEDTKQFIRNIAVGATMPSINTKLLGEVVVTYPDIEKQHRIVGVLSDIDSKIEENERINKNLERQVSSIYEAWFENFLPYDGVCPSDWTYSTLNSIAEITSGKRPPVKSPVQTDKTPIPIVGAASVMGYTSASNHADKILVTGRVGTHGIIQRFNSPCWTSDNTLVITSNFYEYTSQILKRIDYAALNRGSTQPLITQGDMNKIPILRPNDSTLQRFEVITGSLMQKYDDNLIENGKLSELRDTLLPKLMSGELDVSSLDL